MKKETLLEELDAMGLRRVEFFMGESEVVVRFTEQGLEITDFDDEDTVIVDDEDVRLFAERLLYLVNKMGYEDSEGAFSESESSHEEDS